MSIKKLLVFSFILAALPLSVMPGWAQPGKPVMYLSVLLLPENNIIKVSWEPQDSAHQYTVEKWEVPGTNHWYFNINDKMRSYDTRLKIGEHEIDPLVVTQLSNPGRLIEFYDQDVKPGYTYFYRVNGGIIGVCETRKKQVIPLSNIKIDEIRERQIEEQKILSQERKGMFSGKWSDRLKKYEESADYPERMAANLIMAIPNWLIEVVGLHDPIELVFEIDLKDSYKNEDGVVVGRKTDFIWNMYSREEFKVITDFYADTSQAIPVFTVVGVAFAGVLTLLNSFNPGAITTTRSYVLGIMFSVLLFKLGPYLLDFFFDVNRAIVALCHSVVAGETHQSLLHTIYNRDSRSLGSALIAFIACLSIGVINFQFAVRKVFIAILVGLLPIALINAIFPGRRSALTVWVKEFSYYVFMPATFAVGLAFFIHFLNSGDFWITLVCLLTLPMINNMTRAILGLSDSSFTTGIGSVLGMGALFSMGGILKGSKAGKNFESITFPRKSEIVRDLSGRNEVNPDGAGGSGIKLGREAPGITSLVMGSMKNVAGVGITGSMAFAGSLVSGAASGEPQYGREFGIKAGSAVAHSFFSTGASVKNFISEVRENGFQKTTGIVDGSMLMDPGVAASLSTKVLGDNTIGNTVAATAASASRFTRFISPVLAPDARERLDIVSEQREVDLPWGYKKEFDKIRQAQQIRDMLGKIKNSQSTGGYGGVYGSIWR